MNPCPEYEIQILDYDELAGAERSTVDAHLAGCDGCSQFLASLTEVDGAMGAAFPPCVELPSAVTAKILSRTGRRPVKPSFWPEVFDAIGWAALLAVVFAVALVLSPHRLQEAAGWLAFALAITVGSIWFVLQGWRELGRY